MIIENQCLIVYSNSNPIFVAMIWLLAVNDINLVNKAKNQTKKQTKNVSPSFLLCILYLRTSNILISWKLDSFLWGFTENNKLSAVNDINIVNKVKNQTKNLSPCFLPCFFTKVKKQTKNHQVISFLIIENQFLIVLQ